MSGLEDRLRVAASNHPDPRCDRHSEDGDVSFGWKRAYIDMLDVLDGRVMSREWCYEELCRWRHWRSGSMPTHRRGGACPEPAETEQSLVDPEEEG